MEIQQAKAHVLAFYQGLQGITPEGLEDHLAASTSPDWRWRSTHPFPAQIGASRVADIFWKPFLRSFAHIQRRQGIFFAGRNDVASDQSIWVVSMGHLVALFDQAFLGIAPTGKVVFCRYCEFHQVTDDGITQTAFFFDLPHLMVQAGLQPFASQRGAELIHPGPLDHSGLCFAPQEAAQSAHTLSAINKMIRITGQWQQQMPLAEELAHSWHDDMVWWGPTGIGTTYTISRYIAQHAGPFRAAFANRSKTEHCCRTAEGNFGGFFGWPNFTVRLQHPFLGMQPSAIDGEFRVIDIYRRQGNKLAENWVFIDLLYWMKQLGRDLLAEAVATQQARR